MCKCKLDRREAKKEKKGNPTDNERTMVAKKPEETKETQWLFNLQFMPLPAFALASCTLSEDLDYGG
jgi:hypothetical protein